MYISIFDVLGPVMIGPSSSHTAGAARLSRSAREIVKGDIAHISFGLYGSFAETYKGHGTDKALLAGALGLKEDDEGMCRAVRRIKNKNVIITLDRTNSFFYNSKKADRVGGLQTFV